MQHLSDAIELADRAFMASTGQGELNKLFREGRDRLELSYLMVLDVENSSQPFGYSSESLDAVMEYRRNWFAHDDRMMAFLENAPESPGKVFSDRDLFSERELRRSRIHNEFFHPRGIGDFVGFACRSGGRLLLFAAGLRLAEHFSEKRLNSLQYFGERLIGAASLDMQISQQLAFGDVLTEVASRSDRGLASIDISGQITESDRNARSILSPILSKHGDGHLIEDVEARKVFERLASKVFLPGELGSTTQVSLPIAGKRLPLLITARATQDARFIPPRPASAILIIQDLNRSATLNDLPLVSLGLTRAEAKLAVLVGSGTPPKVAAGALGITLSTARSTMAEVHRKLGISRQAALVSIVSRLAS